MNQVAGPLSRPRNATPRRRPAPPSGLQNRRLIDSVYRLTVSSASLPTCCFRHHHLQPSNSFRHEYPPAQQAWIPDTFPGRRCTVGVFTCVWTAHDQTRYSHGTVRKDRAESSVCSGPHVYIYFQWSGLPAMCVAGAGLSLRLLFVCVSPSPHWCRTRQQAINTNNQKKNMGLS